MTINTCTSKLDTRLQEANLQYDYPNFDLARWDKDCLPPETHLPNLPASSHFRQPQGLVVMDVASGHPLWLSAGILRDNSRPGKLRPVIVDLMHCTKKFAAPVRMTEGTGTRATTGTEATSALPDYLLTRANGSTPAS